MKIKNSSKYEASQTILNWYHQSFECSRRKLGVFSLEPMQSALLRFPKILNQKKVWHVAGSVAKGSVCYYLARALENKGHRVGLYTSPHLQNLRERICINELPIPDKEMIRLWRFCESIRDQYKLSFFDVMTLIALIWFDENNCDSLVIETGLGGRLDSTNAINILTKDKISIITPIDLDHTNLLGSTRLQIATEKAGIWNSGCLYLWDDHDEVSEYFYNLARKDNKKKLISISPKFKKSQTNFNLNFVSQIWKSEVGQNFPQIETNLPGRWEKLSESLSLYFDVAHSRRAFQNLAKKMSGINGPWLLWLNIFRERNLDEARKIFYQELGNRVKIKIAAIDDPQFYPGEPIKIPINKISPLNIMIAGSFRLYKKALSLI